MISKLYKKHKDLLNLKAKYADKIKAFLLDDSVLTYCHIKEKIKLLENKIIENDRDIYLKIQDSCKHHVRYIDRVTEGVDDDYGSWSHLAIWFVCRRCGCKSYESDETYGNTTTPEDVYRKFCGRDYEQDKKKRGYKI